MLFSKYHCRVIIKNTNKAIQVREGEFRISRKTTATSRRIDIQKGIQTNSPSRFVCGVLAVLRSRRREREGFVETYLANRGATKLVIAPISPIQCSALMGRGLHPEMSVFTVSSSIPHLLWAKHARGGDCPKQGDTLGSGRSLGLARRR